MVSLLGGNGNKSSVTKNCEICRKKLADYTCPRCKIAYCSLDCYKSPQHELCSENFYKTNLMQSLDKGAKINPDKQTLELQKRLITILNEFNSKQTNNGSSGQNLPDWQYEIPQGVKEKFSRIEEEFKREDLHNSRQLALDDEEDRPLTQQEEIELRNLIINTDSDTLLKLLSPEQLKDFESALKENYILDDDNH